ncbi:MAG: hypothetical protein IKI95_08830 [Clostridia bacterium]|nr:hypothetical protein [Clostridia bacterium]
MNDLTFMQKMLYYILPTNQEEEAQLDKIKYFNIWYGVLSNIITAIFDYKNIDKTLRRRLDQSFFVSAYVGAFEYDEVGGLVFAPVVPIGERNAWGEFTEYEAILPDGKRKKLTLDNAVIGYNYNVPTISDSTMVYQFATDLSEIKISIRNSIILSRICTVIEIGNPNQVDEVLTKFNSMKIGNPIIISKNRTDEEAKSLNIEKPTSVAEYYDGLRDILNEFLTVTGLSSLVNPNKKERLITDEISSNDDIKNTLLKNRVENRIEFIENVNKKFGKNFEVQVNENIKETINDLYNDVNNYDSDDNNSDEDLDE